MPNTSEKRLLEILVAKARGWTVEPYVAVIQIPGYNRPNIAGEYDRFRVRDDLGVVRAEWAFTEESAWDMVPQWATISAHRDELELHIAERFGEVCVRVYSDGRASCLIGGPSATPPMGSGETKGVAVCRAYLAAVGNPLGVAPRVASSASHLAQPLRPTITTAQGEAIHIGFINGRPE